MLVEPLCPMVMHLAIAVVTYNLLVLLAPTRLAPRPLTVSAFEGSRPGR